MTRDEVQQESMDGGRYKKFYQEEDAFSGITDADDAAGVENGHYLFANENTTLSNVETSNKPQEKNRETHLQPGIASGRGCKKADLLLGEEKHDLKQYPPSNIAASTSWSKPSSETGDWVTTVSDSGYMDGTYKAWSNPCLLLE